MNTAFTDDGWDDYTYWLTNDRKVLAKINALIKDIKRSPYQGIGKPERSATWKTTCGRGASPTSIAWCT